MVFTYNSHDDEPMMYPSCLECDMYCNEDEFTRATKNLPLLRCLSGFHLLKVKDIQCSGMVFSAFYLMDIQCIQCASALHIFWAANTLAS